MNRDARPDIVWRTIWRLSRTSSSPTSSSTASAKFEGAVGRELGQPIVMIPRGPATWATTAGEIPISAPGTGRGEIKLDQPSPHLVRIE